jgi:hypothetical protein
MGENYSRLEELVAKELLNGSLYVTDISIRTELPTWNVSRALKRLEIRGHVSRLVEDRRKRGIPRKFYELCPEAPTLPQVTMGQKVSSVGKWITLVPSAAAVNRDGR